MTASRNQFYNSIQKRDLNALKRHINEVRKPLDDRDNLKMLGDLYEAIKDFGNHYELHWYYQAIIDAGVRVSCIDPIDKKTYLDFAISNKRLSVLKWLLKAQDIAVALTIRNPKGLHPLSHAIALGEEEIVAAITEKCEELDVAPPTVQKKPSKLVDFIKANDLGKPFDERVAEVSRDISKINHDEEVREAIAYCLESQYSDHTGAALAKIIKEKSCVRYVKTVKDQSFLHIAARAQNVQILKCIFDANVSYAKEYLNERYDGQTVGDIALALHHQEMLKLITPYGPKFSTHGEKKSDKHKDQRSLLTQHVLNKKNDMLKSVLEQMPELARQEIADSKGHGLTAVECAFIENNYAAAVLLFNAGQPIDRAMIMVAFDQRMKWKDSNTDNDANFKIKLLSAKTQDHLDQGKLLLDAIVNNRLNKAEITLLVKDAKRQIKEKMFETLTAYYSPQEQLNMLSDSLEGKNGLHTVWNTQRGLRSVSSSTGVLKLVIDKVLKLQSKIAESQSEKTPASLSSLVVSEPSAPTEAVVDSVTVSSEMSAPGCQIDHAPCGDFVGQPESSQSVARTTSETVPVARSARFFPVVEQSVPEPLKQAVLGDQVQESVATPQKETRVETRKLVLL